MKKLLFALMAVGLMASASSCKKCGYCKNEGGIPGNNGEAVCGGGSAFENAIDGNAYKEGKAQCGADNGIWVDT
jgi:hypothetical protein